MNSGNSKETLLELGFQLSLSLDIFRQQFQISTILQKICYLLQRELLLLKGNETDTQGDACRWRIDDQEDIWWPRGEGEENGINNPSRRQIDKISVQHKIDENLRIQRNIRNKRQEYQLSRIHFHAVCEKMQEFALLK